MTNEPSTLSRIEKLPVELLEKIHVFAQSGNLELCSRTLHGKLQSDVTRRTLMRSAFSLDRFGTPTYDRNINVETYREDMAALIARPWFYDCLSHHSNHAPFLTIIEVIAWASVRESMMFLLNPPSWTQAHADFLGFIWKHCSQLIVLILTSRLYVHSFRRAMTSGIATAVKEECLSVLFFLTGSQSVSAFFRDGELGPHSPCNIMGFKTDSLVDSTVRESATRLWQWRYLNMFISQASLQRHIYYHNLPQKYLGWGWDVARASDFKVPSGLSVFGSITALIAILDNLNPALLLSSSSATAPYRSIINESMLQTRILYPSAVAHAVAIPRLSEATSKILQLPNCNQYKKNLSKLISDHLSPLLMIHNFLRDFSADHAIYVVAFDSMRDPVRPQRTLDPEFYDKVAINFPKEVKPESWLKTVLWIVFNWLMYYVCTMLGLARS